MCPPQWQGYTFSSRGKQIRTYRSLLFLRCAWIPLLRAPPLGIVGDGAVIIADTIWGQESCGVPRGVGRVRHNDVNKAIFLVIPRLRNGVEKGGENFPQTGDVSIGGLANDGFKNL